MKQREPTEWLLRSGSQNGDKNKHWHALAHDRRSIELIAKMETANFKPQPMIKSLQREEKF